MIHVFSRDGVYKADIGIESILAGDQLYQDLKTGAATYQFAVPSNLEDGIFLENENRILIPNPQGDFSELIIKRVEVPKTSYEKHVEAASSSTNDLNAEYVRPVTFDAKSPKEMLGSVLLGTGWEVGDIAAVGVRTLTFSDYPTILKAVLAIKDEFGLEVRFRVVYENGEIVGRYVDLLEQRGRITGREFEYTRDIVGLRKTQTSDEVYSGVIGLGKTDESGQYLTFKDIELSQEAGGVANKPLGQDYWINPAAEQKWGKKIGKFVDTSIEDPRELFQKSYEWVLKQISVNTEYEIDVALLASFFGADAEYIDVGDTYGVKDLSMVPEVLMTSRIIELTTSLSEPMKGKAVLGDYVQYQNSTAAQIKAIQSQLDYSRGVLSGKARIIRSNTAPADTSVTWVDTSKTPNVVKTYNGTTWVKATPTGTSELSDDAQLGQTANWSAVANDDGNRPEDGADVTGTHTAADTSKVAGAASGTVRDNAARGDAAKSKIDTDVGIDPIESQPGAQAKADAAESAANTYTDDQLTNYVKAVTYNQKVESLQNQIDGAITNWYGMGQPTTANYPASEWTTQAERDQHNGDVYYDKENGYSYRYMPDAQGVYYWELIKDSDITKALAQSAQAQDTADQKRRVFVTMPFPSYDVGDLWDSPSGIKRCVNAKVSGQSYAASDFTLASDITSQNTAADTSKVGGTAASTVRDQAANSVQLDQSYNGSGFSNADGLFSNRSDGLVRMIGNADVGFVIQRRATTNDPWTNVLYFDTAGNVFFAGALSGASGDFKGKITTPQFFIEGDGGVSPGELFLKMKNGETQTGTPIDPGYFHIETLFGSQADPGSGQVSIGRSDGAGGSGPIGGMFFDSKLTNFSGILQSGGKDVYHRGSLQTGAGTLNFAGDWYQTKTDIYYPEPFPIGVTPNIQLTSNSSSAYSRVIFSAYNVYHDRFSVLGTVADAGTITDDVGFSWIAVRP